MNSPIAKFVKPDLNHSVGPTWTSVLLGPAMFLAAASVIALAALFFAEASVAAMVALAAAVCAGAAAAGRTVGGLIPGTQAAGFGLVAGMLMRMGMPLAFCLTVYGIGAPTLVDGGLAFYCLGAYLAMLAMETKWSLDQVVRPVAATSATALPNDRGARL